MVTINLDDKSVENFKAIRELQSMGYSDEQIQSWLYSDIDDLIDMEYPGEKVGADQ